MIPAEDKFSGRRYINLESYKKSGSPKQTPVQSIENDGIIYVRTDPKTWKVKRIKRDPHVRIAISDRSGKPLGSWEDARAQILEGDDRDQIMDLFKKEYGALGNLLANLVARLRGEHMTTVISIKLLPKLQSNTE